MPTIGAWFLLIQASKQVDLCHTAVNK